MPSKPLRCTDSAKASSSPADDVPAWGEMAKRTFTGLMFAKAAST
jgi:hypothetical protein